jgi:signal transduction histidine kinase/CheY-like chemotaxis protein
MTTPLPLTEFDRLSVHREVLRLSMRAPLSSLFGQGLISFLMAGYFGYPDHVVEAVIWLLMVFTGQALRIFLPLKLPAAQPQAVERTLRWHRVRVLFSAFAWGSAGFLLFNPVDAPGQLALTVAIVSSCIAFSFSASSHGSTLKLALPLLLGPIVISLLISPQPYMWVLGLIGASFVLLMLRLVHDRSQQLEENITLRIAAQRARDEKQRFFAAASHDLRQPLQAMHLYHSVMAGGDTRAEVIDRMGQCLEALDRLLDGVLDISRLDAGQVQPHLEPTHVPELMLRVTRLHDATARAKGLRLRLHTADRWVMTDPVLAERILSNLLGNAIRYTESGGVLVAARPFGTSLRLQVFDTGIGIALDRVETVFQEFTQLNNPSRDPNQGTGLGLATVQRLSRLLDHPLEVKSTPGKGSCFEIRLPMVPAPDLTGAGSAQPHWPDHANDDAWPAWQVLVVEDNEMVRNAIVKLLQGWNLQIITASRVAEAIALMEIHSFDAVLSDWRLANGENGLDVLQQTLQHPCIRLAVLITGEHMPDTPTAFPVLRKPVRPLRLRALLWQHLSVRSGAQSSEPHR